MLSALRYRGDVPPLDGGATSLYVACNIGHVDVVQLLVEALRDDTTPDACLCCATFARRYDVGCMKLMLCSFCWKLCETIRRRMHVYVVRLLLEAGECDTLRELPSRTDVTDIPYRDLCCVYTIAHSCAAAARRRLVRSQLPGAAREGRVEVEARLYSNMSNFHTHTE